MRILAIIPARYASERLPGKPLLPICGKPMIQHVYEAAKQATALDDVIVATDDMRIARAVQDFGGNVRMTSPSCICGSDRVYEVACMEKADAYINIQGDEPLLRPDAVQLLAHALRSDASIQVATLCSPIEETEAQKTHCVKVVCDNQGNALYFSRAPIPHVRDPNNNTAYLGHIGVYAYKAKALQTFASLPPSPLEQLEKLEQLRLLQAGIPIRVFTTKAFEKGVDTAEDLETVRTIMGHYDNPADSK